MLYNENFKNIEWNKLIKGIRLTQGLTQEGLGKKLNIHRTQLLIYEQDKKPSPRAKNNIINYIQNNNLNIRELFKIYYKSDYLDKNRLWEKIVDGLQTINGWSNTKTGKLLEVDKTVIQSWKVNNLLPRVKAKSKILKLIDNQNIETLVKYSEINWINYFNEIKKQLPIPNTTLAEALDSHTICINGLINNGKPRFKLRKDLIKLKKLIKEKKDIRDIIFKKRKQRFLRNKYSWIRYVRKELDISQERLGKDMGLSQDFFKKLELGKKNLTKKKEKIIEGKLKNIAESKNINYNKLKTSCIKQINNSEISEIEQWKQRKNIHDIIGFRTFHKKEELYIKSICKLLNKQGFTTFTNATLVDKNLNNKFVIDIYAFKKLGQGKTRICLEVRDRIDNNSVSITFQENINRLNTIKNMFNFDYTIFVVPHLTPERKRYPYKNIILLDNKDLSNLKNNNLLDFIKSKKPQKISNINSIKDFKQYLRQNKLTLRDVSSVTNISFSCISKWRKDKELYIYKQKLNHLIHLVNTKGIAYVKFQRYKKIYTNKNFLKLKAIKTYLNLSEKEFKKLFRIKPSEIVDKCLRNSDYIPKELLLKIKIYAESNNHNWQNLLNYIRNYTNKELQKWKQLEKYNKHMGWKFIKFLDNINKESRILENKVSNFLSEKYNHNLKNVQIYLSNTNQLREIDLISFNTNKDLLITECKLKIPGYGSKILLNDLDTIKNAINAKYSWLVTQETNLNKEFNQIFKS